MLCRKSNQILCSITVFANRAVYEKMRKNVVEPGMSQMTAWRMRIACWVTKSVDTNSEYVILTTFPIKGWLNERASLLRYT